VAFNTAVAGSMLTFLEGDDVAALSSAPASAAWPPGSWLQPSAQVHAGFAGPIGGVAGLFSGAGYATATKTVGPFALTFALSVPDRRLWQRRHCLERPHRAQ